MKIRFNFNHFINITSVLILTSNIYSQGSAGSSAKYESRYIVDMPTAGLLQKGIFSGFGNVYAGGGIMGEFSAAPFKDINIGISYSGNNIIGQGEPVWQGIPGFHARWRFYDETIYYPALLIGVNSQGKGVYDKSTKRFQTLSPGAFIAASKTYKNFIGVVSFHVGVNYSFEPKPEKRSVNCYLGFEQSFASVASFNIEYNSNLDEKDKIMMNEQGLLNASFSWNMARNITIELQARDILKHYQHSIGFTRVLSLEYISMF